MPSSEIKLWPKFKYKQNGHGQVRVWIKEGPLSIFWKKVTTEMRWANWGDRHPVPYYADDLERAQYAMREMLRMRAEHLDAWKKSHTWKMVK